MQNSLVSIPAYLSLALPLVSFLVANLLKGRVATKSILYVCVGMVCIAAISIDFAFFHFCKYINTPNVAANSITLCLWKWLDIAPYIYANLTINIDMLSGMMCILVLNVSALVHVYSIGYMSEDPHQEKFISYLSLFTFFMLILVLSDNLLQMFIGWEGVGLCSYLLIGFWYHKKKANKAAIKAFIVNRVGDVGLVLAIAMMLMTFKSIEFASILDHTKILQVLNQTKYYLLGVELTAIDIICSFLFIGCMGKSAQLLLHVWLPDAMEGPTPVSALIHAATMVTAGVFLVVRCSPLFEQSEMILNIITIVGSVTAMFAATIALAQNDIKKIIAYSTCSQLGYMFFACGVSAYSQGIFHLLTHGFFKALLFLSAGSVIHGMNGEQNIHKVGGLRKHMQITYTMIMIGSLALGGIFPFAGFYSKDAILESAMMANTKYGEFAYYMGLAAAFLTAFYSWRLIILVFEKSPKKPHKHHPHESTLVMLVPLGVLAIGAIFAGITGQWLGVIKQDLQFWHGSIFVAKQHINHHIESSNILLEWLPMIVGIVGIALAYAVYFTNINNRFTCKVIQKILHNAYYFDRLYKYIFVLPLRKASLLMYKFSDNKIINGILTSIVQTWDCCASGVKQIHGGNVQHYAMVSLFIISMFFYSLTSDGVYPNIMFWLSVYTGVMVYIGLILFIRKTQKLEK